MTDKQNLSLSELHKEMNYIKKDIKEIHRKLKFLDDDINRRHETKLERIKTEISSLSLALNARNDDQEPWHGGIVQRLEYLEQLCKYFDTKLNDNE